MFPASCLCWFAALLELYGICMFGYPDSWLVLYAVGAPWNSESFFLLRILSMTLMNCPFMRPTTSSLSSAAKFGFFPFWNNKDYEPYPSAVSCLIFPSINEAMLYESGFNLFSTKPCLPSTSPRPGPAASVSLRLFFCITCCCDSSLSWAVCSASRLNKCSWCYLSSLTIFSNSVLRSSIFLMVNIIKILSIEKFWGSRTTFRMFLPRRSAED